LNRWILIKKNINIPKDFIGTIKLILSSIYFTFNSKVYRQTFGSPMSSPLSPIIANLVLQDLQEKALEKIDCSIPLSMIFETINKRLKKYLRSDYLVILITKWFQL